MRMLASRWMGAWLGLLMAACGEDLSPDDAGHALDDGGSSHPTCQVQCGACEPPLSITVYDDAASGSVVDAWSAHITGQGTDCRAESSFDSCISALRPGKYKVQLAVDGADIGSRDVIIAPTHPPAGACCDCGYMPATLGVHYGTPCGSDSGIDDSGLDDSGASGC